MLGQSCITWIDGRWHDGNAPVLGAADHATWMGNLVFDGARAFDGVTPDLDRHCRRLIRSARAMGLEAPMAAGDVEALILQGVRRMGNDKPMYLRPMVWAREGSPAIIDPLPGSAALAICIEHYSFRAPGSYALTVSPFRRPPSNAALNEAKAACHYANNARVVTEARSRGFQNGLSLDQEGNVAETSVTNVFMVRDRVVRTPVPNGTFLDGITRQRVIALLRADGMTVEEAPLTVEDFARAQEIFLTGNAQKITPVTRFEARELGSGPVAARARELYWDFAHQSRRAA